jgi:hypothetical protein
VPSTPLSTESVDDGRAEPGRTTSLRRLAVGPEDTQKVTGHSGGIESQRKAAHVARPRPASPRRPGDADRRQGAEQVEDPRCDRRRRTGQPGRRRRRSRQPARSDARDRRQSEHVGGQFPLERRQVVGLRQFLGERGPAKHVRSFEQIGRRSRDVRRVVGRTDPAGNGGSARQPSRPCAGIYHGKDHRIAQLAGRVS